MTEFRNASLNSSTSGPVSLGTAVANVIGRPHSAIPSASVSEPSASLAKLTPAETDARVAESLERISGRRPEFKRRTLIPNSGPIYSITEAATWRCENLQQQSEALAAVEFSLRPAPEDALGAALYTLRIMTRGRERYESDDREAEAIVWLEQLRKFPADIALSIIKGWPERSDGQWWPTWHDVQKELEAQTSARRLLASHIRSGACLGKPGVDLDRDDSPEAIAHRQAVVERCRMTRYDWKQIAEGKVPEPDPINPVDDYIAWEEREKERLRAESKSGRYHLSAEALGIATPSTPLSTQDEKAA